MYFTASYSRTSQISWGSIKTWCFQGSCPWMTCLPICWITITPSVYMSMRELLTRFLNPYSTSNLQSTCMGFMLSLSLWLKNISMWRNRAWSFSCKLSCLNLNTLSRSPSRLVYSLCIIASHASPLFSRKDEPTTRRPDGRLPQRSITLTAWFSKP